MPKKANVCSLLDATIDWSTTTYPTGLRARFAASKASHILRARQEAGFDVTDSSRLGFTGLKSEGLFYGWRDDLLIVICSGEVASAHSSFFLGLADKVTRLDLAVTLQDANIDRDWTEIALQQCSMDGRVDSGLLKTSRIIGSPDGATLYIGRRSSARFIRIYDKTAESKHAYPERSWRWEIEWKKQLAGMVSARLLQQGEGRRGVIDVVHSALADLRITLPIEAPVTGWVPTQHGYVTDDERRLKYTSRVIAPFLKTLVESVGEQRVAEALDRSTFVKERVMSEETGEIIK